MKTKTEAAMTENLNVLTEKLRNYVFRYGVELTDDKLQKVGLSRQEIDDNFSSMEEIAETIFEQERVAFEKIFDEYNFDGWNAIDILLLVGNEINNRFFDISPSVSYKLAKAFPDIFERHRTLRSAFIYEKIKINIEKGMEQGMYKNDVSSEMIARMYLAKLNDIHNTEIYPPECFSFATIFNNLIDDVIKAITNKEGWQYYKQRKQLYSILNFNR